MTFTTGGEKQFLDRLLSGADAPSYGLLLRLFYQKSGKDLISTSSCSCWVPFCALFPFFLCGKRMLKLNHIYLQIVRLCPSYFSRLENWTLLISPRKSRWENSKVLGQGFSLDDLKQHLEFYIYSMNIPQQRLEQSATAKAFILNGFEQYRTSRAELKNERHAEALLQTNPNLTFWAAKSVIKHQAIDSTLVGLLNTNLKVKYWEMRNGKKLRGERQEKQRKARVDRCTKELRVWLNYTILMRHVLSRGTQFNHRDTNFHPLLQILGEALSKQGRPGSHHCQGNAQSQNCTVRQNCYVSRWNGFGP